MGEAKRRKAAQMSQAIAMSCDMDAYRIAREIVKRIFDHFPDAGFASKWRMIYKEAYRFADEAGSFAAKEGKAACSIGCAACCHQLVAVSPFEAFMIGFDILANQTSWAAFVYTAASGLAKLPLTPQDRHKKPCALLKDNKCGVYEQRPFPCRTNYSTDRKACEGSSDFPALYMPRRLGISVRMALDWELMARHSVHVEPIDLAGALTLILPDFDKSWNAWQQGDDLFEAHREDEKPLSTSYTNIIRTVARQFDDVGGEGKGTVL